jgi:C4-dicarboxylate transporter DctQ subunit
VATVVALAAGAVLLGQVVLLTWSVVQGVGQFRHQAHWLEEIVEFALLEVGFLGAAVALRERAHQGVDAMVHLLPRRAQQVIEVIDWIVLAGFGVVFARLGWLYVAETVAIGGDLSVAPLPKWPFYCVYPLTGALFVLFAVENALRALRGELTEGPAIEPLRVDGGVE